MIIMVFKKGAGVFVFIIFCFSFILTRLYYLSSSPDIGMMTALIGSRTKRVTIYESRGIIYDYKLRPFTDDSIITKAVVDPMLLKDRDLIISNVSDELKKSIIKSLDKGTPFCVTVKNPVNNIPGITCYRSADRYSYPYNAVHTIGYLDNSKGALGIEKSFDSLLSQKPSKFTAVFNVDGAMRTISGLNITTEGDFSPEKSGVVLTLDKDIQKISDEACDKFINSGALVVLDVKTGKIRALSSRPGFSPYDLQNVNKNDGAFINRCLTPFNVGSAFKIADTAAFLENGGLPSYSVNCTGGITVGNNTIACQKKGGHGHISLNGAFSDSCNVYFISIMKETGKDNLLKMVESFYFGRETILADGIVSKAGKLPTLKNLSAPAALANFSIGQGELLATPLQIASMVQTVCNNGQRIEPSLIEGTADKNMTVTAAGKKPESKVMSAATAAAIRQLMINTVEYGSGGRSKPEAFGAGVKTATAQTGIMKDGNLILNGWIAGFFPADDPKYAVAVLVEDAVSGAKSAGPAFKYVADNVNSLVPRV